MNYNNSEIDYLAELMADFPVNNCPAPNDAFNLVSQRFESLSEVKLSNILSLPVEYKRWPKKLHEILFENILSNAGEYRKSSDKHSGNVNFGGQNPRTVQIKFHGLTAKEIEAEIDIISSELENSDDPISASIIYYQKFVKIHPFYDANGRIARLIVSMFLMERDLIVNWKSLTEKQSEFLRRLNECHERSDSPVVTQIKYQKYLVDFWSKFITRINEMDENYEQDFI